MAAHAWLPPRRVLGVLLPPTLPRAAAPATTPQVFHPSIDESGHVDMSLLGDDWRPDMCAAHTLPRARPSSPAPQPRSGCRRDVPSSPASLHTAPLLQSTCETQFVLPQLTRRCIKTVIYGLWRLFLMPESGGWVGADGH